MIYFSTVQYTKNYSHNKMIIEIVNAADRIKGIIYPQKSNWFDKNNILLYVYLLFYTSDNIDSGGDGIYGV